MYNIEQLCLASQSPTATDQSGLDLEEAFFRSRSNFIPNSVVERSQYRVLIAEARRNFEKCDLEDIRRVQLAKLLELQESLLLAPIRRLPPEILSEIFKLVAPGPILVRPGFSRRAGISIFPLAWVSSLWREIIVSQPSFWSVLGMELAELCLDIEHAILRVCLARSGTVPICLYLLCSQVELNLGLCRVLDDLARHADKWKVFKLRANAPILNYILKQACHFTGNPFSILDTMLIDANDVSADGILGNSFIRCPQLHNLDISHLRATDTAELTHLVKLQIGFYQGCSFAVLLEKCPMLKTLTVHYVNPFGGTPIPIPRVHHTHLRTLNLKIDKHVVAGAWQSVQLPNLTHLQARDINKGSFCDVAKQRFDELKAMLSYSQCILDRVQLLGDLNPYNDIVASLFQGIHVRSESNSRFVGDHPYNPSRDLPTRYSMCRVDEGGRLFFGV
ncbi:hypothetical protein BT96DRAFT_121133 [Gymnopus androsaceus JB14]|uniref:Uncharacterized protein n=1 Tax=Gymnopus androsaceus JB14 TaxID=1447944 RepID=A0A6A4HE92_9AGAR|nr:hypothetical protein BT96DRAFT_121133 [Gymnopus androsaceus JB14]